MLVSAEFSRKERPFVCTRNNSDDSWFWYVYHCFDRFGCEVAKKRQKITVPCLAAKNDYF